MDRVDKLSKNTPFIESQTEYLSEWVDLGNYKNFKCVVYSDVMLSIEIHFSCHQTDEKKCMSVLKFKSPSKLFKYLSDEVRLPFVRIKVSNETGLRTEEMEIVFLAFEKIEKRVRFEPKKRERAHSSPPAPSVPSPLVIKSEPISNLQQDLKLNLDDLVVYDDKGKEKEKPVERAVERFRSPFARRKHVSHLSVAPKAKAPPVKDCRLPEVILKNQILIGSSFGNVKGIPIGLENQVLTVGEDGLEWRFPYPPKG